MKKYLKLAIISILLLLLSSSPFWLYIYTTRYQISDVSTYASNDNRYMVKFEMVGEPVWSFGPTYVRVKIYRDYGIFHKKLEVLNDDVANDGKTVSEDNCHVEWQPERVLIILSGEEQEDKVYQITLE